MAGNRTSRHTGRAGNATETTPGAFLTSQHQQCPQQRHAAQHTHNSLIHHPEHLQPSRHGCILIIRLISHQHNAVDRGVSSGVSAATTQQPHGNRVGDPAQGMQHQQQQAKDASSSCTGVCLLVHPWTSWLPCLATHPPTDPRPPTTQPHSTPPHRHDWDPQTPL